MHIYNAIKDEYTITKNLKILMEEQLNIPGLHLFGHQTRTAAVDALPTHHHGSCYEMVFVASGNPGFVVEGKTEVLSGGDVFITRPWELHSTGSVPVSVSEIYWMQLDLSACKNPFYLDEEAAGTLRRRIQGLSAHTIHTELRQVKPLLQNAFQLALSGQDPQFAAQYLTLFFYLILDRQKEKSLTPDIERAVAFIREHITEKLSLEMLARQAYLSTSQFKQKFKEQMGIAPRQYINTRKIDRAKELLQAGYSTAQTAAALQFDSPSYFITVFKRYTSATPGEYREQVRGKGRPAR